VDLIRNLSLDALLAFAEFAEDGNFSHAAIRLHISQPALHTKIGKLGRLVGLPLYVKRGRAIEITPAGRKLQRFAREMAASMHTFQNDLLEQDVEQPVVLAAGEGSYLYLLGEGIRACRADRKHRLQLMTADGTAAVDAVQSGRAHLGVASLETIPPGLHATPLTRVGQVLAVPRQHALTARRQIRLKELNHAELIVPPVRRPHRVMLSQMLQSAGMDWCVAVEASGWELMLHLVRLGIGLAVVNACCRLPPGVLSRPISELPSLQYFVFSRETSVPAAVSALRQNLLHHANDWMTQ